MANESNLKPGRGRPKGTPNKYNKLLKDKILGALDDLGGQDWLVEEAKKNPPAFFTLIGKVLPTTLNGNLDVNATITEIKRSIVYPKHDT